ncbi:hypothetical protein QZH41_009087 [Actinostola sp. cb2023]|nr:hypothetical protein QZH41_009087 [Actinostola sp. cb2023]
MGSRNEVWLAKIKEFRGMKLDGNQQIDENFLLDILDELCHENVSEYVKLQLLFALQEKVSSLTSDITSIECAVGSLKDMFLHPSGHPSQLYLSQILVTGTCLVISSDLLIKSHEVFVTFIGVLTDIIEKVNTSNNLLVRKTACECLWEMELSYPGLFQSKLCHFYKQCESESSPIFQSYMSLFVTVLRHTIEQLASKSFYGLETDCLNQLLTDYSEPLKPLTFPSEVTSETFPLALHSPPCGIPIAYLPEKLNSKELRRAISFLMENIGLLNTTSLFHVMLELMHCIKLTEISPITFKSQFIQWISSSDVSIFHILLFMRLKFSIDMFQEGDDILLLQRLLILAGQPTLPNDYRLLCFKWLMHFPEELCKSGRAPVEPTVSSFFIEDVHHFYPSGFDSLDILQDKLKLLCLYFWSNETEDSLGTDTLMNCLSLINKQVLLGIGGNSIRALFRTLFWYYRYFYNTSLVQDIYRLVVSVITKHPKFMAHVVDFLDSIAMVTPDSPFPVDLLRVLSQHVVAQPLSAVLPNLPHHLKLLAQAMTKSNIDPSSTVRFLDLLLQTSELSSQGEWSLGNCILAVCHSILLHHDTRHVIRDLGNLLLNMSTTYQDIDIRDRARFYYSLLANVSSEKASKILMSETIKQQSLNVMADDITSSSFATAPPVQHIKTPFLRLTRVSKNIMSIKNDEEELPSESTLDLQPYGLLGHYSKMINDSSWNPDISIDYYVHFNDLESPARLYALVLQFGSNRTYAAMKDIHIPFLSQTTSAKPQQGCHQIKVVFQPREPVPACFSVRAVFHNENGLTCTMVLDRLQIRLQDLFLPITLPEMFHNENSSKTKKKLFKILWDDVTEKQRTMESPSNRGAMSVVCLSLPWQKALEILNTHFQPFVIETKDKQVHVGILLPPSQHLLLKFTTRNQKTVVSIATDDWRALGLVESHLHELESLHGEAV